MAVVVVTNSNLRLDNAEATTGWASDGAGGAGPQLEPDFVRQGSNSVSRKIGTTKGGFAYIPTNDGGAATNMTVAADSVMMCKIIAGNFGAVQAAPAVGVRIGSTNANYIEYYIADNGTFGDDEDILYPVLGGWLIVPVNPNVIAFRDAITGTPNIAAVNFISVQGFFTGTAKSENLAMDAIDIGPGLFLVGGDGADPDGTFESFVDHDEGTIANRFGYWVPSNVDPELYAVSGFHVLGRNAAGTNSATVFESIGQTLIFPDNRLDTGQTGLEFDLTTAQTLLQFTNQNWKGLSRGRRKFWFDSNAEVDGTAEVVTIQGHTFRTGDYVLYSKQGSALVTGLTDATSYFVRRVSADTVSFHTTKANAHADTARVNLSVSTSPGDDHSLEKVIDTRPVLLSSGSGTGVAGIDNVIVDNFGICDLSDIRAFIENCTFQNTRSVEIGGNISSFIGNSFSGMTTERGEAALITPSLTVIDSCAFTHSKGHAIEITATGTYALDGCDFTGYGPNPAEFDSTTGINAGTGVITTDAEHFFFSGDTVYYNDEGGGSVGLTDGALYYVNRLSSTTLALFRSHTTAAGDFNRVPLSTLAGNQTHRLYSSEAALLNDTGGTVTVNVSNGPSPTYRNVGLSVTNVNQTVTLTINVADEAGDPIATAQTAIYDGSTELMNEDTTAGGVATESYNFTVNTDISIRVRKNSPGDTRYLPFTGTGQITPDGFTLNVTLIEDPNAPA